MGQIYREKIKALQKKPPEISTDPGPVSSKSKKKDFGSLKKIVDDNISIIDGIDGIIPLTHITPIDVAEVPENDAEVADWLSLVLKDPDGAKCWQNYLNKCGVEIIKTGLKRLNKRLRKGLEIRNYGAYLNSIIKSILWERQRQR